MRWVIGALIVVLLLVGCRQGERPQTETNPKPTSRGGKTGLVERGKRVYDETGCATCHAIGGVGGTIGPNLDGVGKKYDEAKLRQILRKPTTLNPNTTMPAFEGSEEDMEALVAYLKSLR